MIVPATLGNAMRTTVEMIRKPTGSATSLMAIIAAKRGPVRAGSELAAAVAASARDLGLAVDWAADPAAAGERDLVLAIGYPRFYPWLSQGLSATRRVACLGEPLPPADDPPVARLRRALPMGRIVDAVSASARLAGRPPSCRMTGASRSVRPRLTAQPQGAPTGVKRKLTMNPDHRFLMARLPTAAARGGVARRRRAGYEPSYALSSRTILDQA